MMDSSSPPSSLSLTAEEIQTSVVSTSSSSTAVATPRTATFTPRYPCLHHPLGQPGAWNPCCDCFFSSLPDSLLTNEIFTFLSLEEKLTVAAVSTRFNFLIEETPLGKVQVTCRPSSGIGLQRLLQRQGDTVQALVLRNIQSMEDSSSSSSTDTKLPILPLPTLFSNLRTLDLSGNKHLSPDVVTNFILRHGGDQLHRLILDGVVSLTDQHLTSILSACTSLTHLSLNQCRGLTDQTLEALALSSSRYSLISLRLNSCSGMSIQGIEQVIRCSSRSVSTKTPYRSYPSSSPNPPAINQLRILEIRGIRSVLSCASLVPLLAYHSPYLRILDIGSNDPFGTSFSASSNNATELTDTLLQTLTYGCSLLESLSIAGHNGSLSDKGVALALDTLPSLRKFDIRGCRSIGDETMASIARNNLPLQELRCGINTLHFTDQGLVNLLSTEKVQENLQSLDLYGCRKLTIEGFEQSIGAWYKGREKKERTLTLPVPKIYIGGIPLFRNYRITQSHGNGNGGEAFVMDTNGTSERDTMKGLAMVQIVAH